MRADRRGGGSFSSGAIWSTATFVGSRALSFLSVLVLARLLTPSEFGAVAAIVVFLALIELGSDLGLKATVIYEQETGVSERVQTAFTANLLLAVVLTGMGILLAPLVASFFHLEEQTNLFRLGALNLLFTGLGNIQDSLLLRELEFRRRIFPELVRALVRAAVGISLALAGFGASALVLGFLAGTAAWAVVQSVITRFRPRFTLDRSILRSMAAYGGGAAMLEVVSVVAVRVDVAVIGRLLGERALGLYTIALRVPELLIESVAWNLSLVAFPAFARQRARDEEGLAPVTVKVFTYQALYAIPISVGLAILGPPLIVVLFSSAWTEAGGVASAIAVMAGFSAVAFPMGDVFKALGRQRTLVLFNVVQIPVFTVAIVAVSSGGIVPVAWARAAFAGLWALLICGTVFRLLSVRPSVVARALAPAVAAGAGVAMGAGAVRVAWPGLAVAQLLAGAAAGALGALIFLRLLAPAMFFELRGLAGRLTGSKGAKELV
ncbi:MAG: oligosaccharide flippase family protein [Thermoleophilaceae bacterium]